VMADDDDDWETDPDFEATNTDAAWLEKKMEAAKIVNNVYVPEGYQPEEPETDISGPGAVAAANPPPTAAATPPAPTPPKPQPPTKQAEPPPPPVPVEPPKSGVSMRFLVPSQAKAPPKLPPS